MTRTTKRKHLFTVRMLDAVGEHIAHQEHIVGLAGVAAYKQEMAVTSDRRIAYVRIFNETTGNTRYEGLPEWPAGHAKRAVTS